MGVELNRTDLTAAIPDFISRAEARFRRDLRDWLTTNLTATNVTADYVLPVTVQEVLSVNYADGANGAHNFGLDLVTREAYQQWMELQSDIVATAGQLAYVDVDQDANTTTLRFWPPAGSTNPIANLRIEIVKVLPSLSATQTTNALLRDAPDLYLYGALVEAGSYLQHDERVAQWDQRVTSGIRALRIVGERRKFGGAPRPRKLAQVFG